MLPFCDRILQCRNRGAFFGCPSIAKLRSFATTVDRLLSTLSGRSLQATATGRNAPNPTLAED
jgi:hypothetical protein